MHITNTTEFRSHSAEFLTAAENGEVIIIMRHGKAIAKLSPITADDLRHSWQEPALKLKIKGLSLTDELLKDRDEQS
ncbi:MAG: type II toxin-antitoxin system Phd/YefM family antitoxin [Pseudomonadota bacterium]|nr:type II toxin-antitoxin system Phd/YefM family antitoxin [Pseudomonadota bacterium]